MKAGATGVGTPQTCEGCGTELAPNLVLCPFCRKLVHSRRLKELSAEAEDRATGGQWPEALSAWREMVLLLPESSPQSVRIQARIEEASRRLDVKPAPGPGSRTSRRKGMLAGLAVLGLVLWKFKFVLGFLATKGKLLLLGLTKSTTLFSMALSVGVYWSVWGWRFAAGIVLSMYVHEMGHVSRLRRLGIRATAPMFVPGLGAFVRLKQYPASPREDARVGLAGPVWGAAAAVAAWGISLITGNAYWAAIARFGAWLNLLNLIPVWSLDGGRGFRSLTRSQRWIAAAGIATAWILTSESLLVILLLAACIRALESAAPSEPDLYGLGEYLGLLAGLSALCTIQVPLPV